MRTSIQATNVVLNLAVVPNVILMPSNFVILDKKVEGYNNILTTATDEMKFGINKDVNYAKPKPSKSKPKPSNGSSGSDSDNDDDTRNGNSSNDSSNVHDNVRSRNERVNTGKSASSTQLPITFFLSLTAGVFLSKKIFS